MKRKIFIGLASVVAVAATCTTLLITKANNTSKMSDLMSKNIEALTQYEGDNEICLSDSYTSCTLWMIINGHFEAFTVENREKEYL
jgi:hypothetical protein